MKTPKIQTQYADLLPPLSTEEFAALRASIKEAGGVRVPIVVDEDGNVLDGHHRLRIDPNAKRVVMRGLSDAEKRAFVYASNLTRRNLSSDQKKIAAKAMRQIAMDLREQDPKKYTQAKIAATMGVTQQAVALWLATDTSTCNGCPKPTEARPDARVKVNPAHKPVIAERVENGETQEQVAADYGVSRQAIAKIVTQVTNQDKKREERKATIATLGDTLGVHHGDFREVGKIVADNSVDLIFTDPPYCEEDLGLYGDLGKFAARVLRPGGWCLAYTGQYCLPRVLNLMSEQLTYAWCFCITHSGGNTRYRKYQLYNSWKPIVGFYKPPLKVWWDWFADHATGGAEKSDHPWQQAQVEAEHYIRALCPEGGVVCEPFCGSGTTVAAAQALKRQWVGFEIDQESVEKTRVRLHDAAVKAA